MIITDVRSIQPVADGSPADWRTSMGQILVAIETDVGLTGYGVGGGGLAGVHVVKTVLRDVLLEQSPDSIESLWEQMYEATLAFGRKGIAIMALSGVDLALWDLKGKAEKLPVAKLLGGDVSKAVPTYVTVWDDVPEEVLENYSAFKLHVGKVDSGELEEDVVARVRKARRRIGPEKPLMIDAWMKWSVTQTLAIAKQIEVYDVGWIEEPISPDDLGGYAELRDRCNIPIAGGEHEFTQYGFAPLIENRLHTVLQPDICWCGGMTEMVKIYRMAKNAEIRVCPHRGAEVWGLHAIVALDSQPLAESGRPWMTWVNGQPMINDGMIQIREEPGFGVTIDDAKFSDILTTT
ncbi:MAG: mandelate racemase/muconate lactonizing enzyme family protein [Gemmataceae bacterium]